ncbi:NADP-specific glutamate dehydrogenase GdhA [Desulfopila sp. IMCC35006]|uniref:NAD-glutamate dehydrogenase domain-containing protein n=1 Tax=Desulfopila sp. IMCC35006 TaxID=2569542 RepID=UPI0010AC5353|nr:NAD-glutamate dehydrogenase domain-containing protein [Desulfopila sp. IMCC35006]TKB26321.1 NADP-specific glutamate dehydrogenase GdhA [Desulfopila sp. IMCC35006]
MDTFPTSYSSITRGEDIIAKAESVGLDPRVLYEAVIDLSSEGLLTANCINMAAGILLKDIGLPRYFFENIRKAALAHLLESIATSIKVVDGKVILYGRVSQIDFDVTQANVAQRVRIATEETRDNMEAVLEGLISGHRREYYYSPASNYYTYIIRPETVNDFPRETFKDSRFLFTLAGDYTATPEPTRKRYEKVLRECEESTIPLIAVFNLPETGETRLMFNSDFESPQIPVLRKILADHDLTLVRAYWEPYLGQASVPSSICTLYVSGELTRKQEDGVVTDLRSYLSFSVSSIKDLYLDDRISFQEMLFAGNAIDFTHLFVFKESENVTDREILENLASKDQRESFAKRIQSSNKSTYGAPVIMETVTRSPDLIKFLHALFELRFAPERIRGARSISDEELQRKWLEFEKIIAGRFIDYPLGYEIFKFMFKIITCTLKTNFYKPEKRSFAFRFDNSILDPLVFSRFVFGVFFVNGHYSCGTHLRAADVARGGLRLIRVSRSNYDSELDNAVLLNYALGPKAQRLKHKDICESGSKGVVVPLPQYASYRKEALNDYTEGIMDLMLPDSSVVDYYGKPEMVFFGPDEGTAPLMDDVAYHARDRGYQYWRTITTGKSFGIPHDTYGLLQSGETFGLYDKGSKGVELQVDGRSVIVTDDMEKIFAEVGESIAVSGMTTTSIMGSFRTLIDHYKAKEEELNLMITGGPDGDLGANQIQCYKGKICLIVDGGSILFDPQGLDKKELMKLAFMRNSSPRANSLQFPVDKLSKNGFMVPIEARNVTLPDGTIVEDGALFHRNFLSNPAHRKYISEANIRAFIPCGGFKDTINQGNIRRFLELFGELQFIVEGANVFFDDAARRYIATQTNIKQIKDSTANKGGVFSSSIAEVLTGFLLQEDYEDKLLNDSATRWALTKDVLHMVDRYGRMETGLLLRLYDADPSVPLFELSEFTSEQIFALQDELELRLVEILADSKLVWKVMVHYIPSVLCEKLGAQHIMDILNTEQLQSYRDAIITKKLASMAFYRFGERWEEYLGEIEAELLPALHKIFAD